MVIMPRTTFILVTVFFGIICGNRLMEKRLLKSASALYTPYKSISDVKVNFFNGPINDDLKLKDFEKTSETANPPCGSDIGIENDLPARNCNYNLVNLLRNPPSYLDDSIHNNDDIKSYQNIGNFEDDNVFEVEPVEPSSNSKNIQLLQPKLNILPVANYKDFYKDLVVESIKEEVTKRNGNSFATVLGSAAPRGCDCKIRNDIVDLGQQHFPRYLLSAVCYSEHSRNNDLGPKCWSGAVCRPLEYKVKVLTYRTLMDNMQKDPTLAWLPDDLRQIWKFKTVTVTAGCFCS